MAVCTSSRWRRSLSSICIPFRSSFVPLSPGLNDAAGSRHPLHQVMTLASCTKANHSQGRRRRARRARVPRRGANLLLSLRPLLLRFRLHQTEPHICYASEARLHDANVGATHHGPVRHLPRPRERDETWPSDQWLTLESGLPRYPTCELLVLNQYAERNASVSYRDICSRNISEILFLELVRTKPSIDCAFSRLRWPC